MRTFGCQPPRFTADNLIAAAPTAPQSAFLFQRLVDLVVVFPHQLDIVRELDWLRGLGGLVQVVQPLVTSS